MLAAGDRAWTGEQSGGIEKIAIGNDRGRTARRARGCLLRRHSDHYVSPLARDCNELFLASIESTSFCASYPAPVALLNAILAAVGQYRRPQILGLVKEIAEEHREGFRWYNP